MILLIYFLEREEGREKEWEKNVNVRKKHRSAVPPTPPQHLYTLQRGQNLQTRRVPRPGIEPVAFHFAERCPSN